ncbi:rhodanese-like domain-containing protein [Mucilaginibacter gilvus]|uniref:Rhodanese-like domain-containing protein n=1 Tax=Mucilaginibacter gilvus TaxID=2305909 RepID=A0A3S3VHP0_9SPHI|nr:rhodanese-like domain-containing protein [Mucilaginibacter gilvus]RWY48562.1 rhodanese-like domain-containing protein [Mucilaginibacter gilvus]
MKKICLITLLGLLAFGTLTQAQTSPKAIPMLLMNNPWIEKELLAPSELATAIKSGAAKTPLILNIGAVEDIKGAQHIGAVSDAENLVKLRRAIADLPKNTEVVIYCGCCPFTKCPNIRPAFNELKKSGFTDIKLLNLPVNLNTNWVTKGYPLAAK